MANFDPLLQSLGITSAAPFNWGDEPHAKLEPKKPAAPATLSGLDSIKQYVQDKDDPVKRVITSLLVKANVPLTVKSSGDNSARKRYFGLLEEDGDISSRDVSIRGLSDRACAELTVESRSSLFGSILRIFDMTKEDKEMVASGASAPADEAKAVAVTQQTASTEDNIPVATKVAAAPKQTDGSCAAPKNQSNAVKTEAPIIPAISPEITEAAKKNTFIFQAPILSTAEIVRSCHLAASPGDIPPDMDSKQYTMAALHFLSSHVPMISEHDDEIKRDKSQSMHSWKLVKDTFPILPLLHPINPQASLEKRVYGRVKPLVELGKVERKECPDSMDLDLDFRRKVLNLERAFTSSLPFTSNTSKQSALEIPLVLQKYLPRRRLCPRIETEGVKEELTLMISGHVQQESQSGAAAKKPKITIP
ncbi:hypothetical protein ACHAXN_004540 [Cyclotella atomus]